MIVSFLFRPFIFRIEEGQRKWRKPRAKPSFSQAGKNFTDMVFGLYFTRLPSKMRARTTPRCAFVTPEIDIEKVENAIKKMSLVRFSIFLAKLGLDEDEFCDSWAPAERLRVFKKLRASGEITWEQVVSKLTNPKSFIKQTPQGPGTSPTCVNVLADLQRSHSLLDAAMFALKNLQKGCNLNMPPGHV